MKRSPPPPTKRRVDTAIRSSHLISVQRARGEQTARADSLLCAHAPRQTRQEGGEGRGEHKPSVPNRLKNSIHAASTSHNVPCLPLSLPLCSRSFPTNYNRQLKLPSSATERVSSSSSQTPSLLELQGAAFSMVATGHVTHALRLEPGRDVQRCQPSACARRCPLGPRCGVSSGHMYLQAAGRASRSSLGNCMRVDDECSTLGVTHQLTRTNNMLPVRLPKQTETCSNFWIAKRCAFASGWHRNRAATTHKHARRIPLHANTTRRSTQGAGSDICCLEASPCSPWHVAVPRTRQSIVDLWRFEAAAGKALPSELAEGSCSVSRKRIFEAHQLGRPERPHQNLTTSRTQRWSSSHRRVERQGGHMAALLP
ncbi:hypothetical protein V8E36_007243 [Tilletia maclaganii]